MKDNLGTMLVLQFPGATSARVKEGLYRQLDRFQYVRQGVLARVDIGERGTRYEYRLTELGLSLMPVIVAMSQWANDEVYGAGHEPVELYERSSGKKLLKMLPRDRDGKPLRA